MSKTMLINVILEEESRVTIVDNGVLDFFEIETRAKGTLKGNIYKGIVDNVNSSLDAAFVDCGWDRPGFLPLDEVNFKVLPTLKGRKGGSRIHEHVAPGMEILVQVIRDRFGTKPPSLTTYYSLPGRYLVLMPFTDSSGVSRRIEGEEDRSKLKQLLDDLQIPEKYGIIVRTAGLDQSRRELMRDMGYLLQLWETIERAAAPVRAPSLIFRERNLALRTIRDFLTDDIEEVLIDDEAVYDSALRFIRAIAPHQEPRIKLHRGDKPLFTRFNLEEQIETLYKRRVPLKSGGEIVIEPTEAMTAIDVNSSRSREASVEDLALRTNVEAAAEVARQIRLRDIGGLIVVDFIDMEVPKHLREVEKRLLDAMKRDKAKFDATRISKLGMLEISRQRLKAAKSAATYEVCDACDGAGAVRTVEAAALSALRKIQTRVVRGDISALGVTAQSDVALYLLNNQRDEILALERKYGVKIGLTPKPNLPRERCDIELTAREGVAPPRPEQETVRPRREPREIGRGPRGRREPVPQEVAESAETGRSGAHQGRDEPTERTEPATPEIGAALAEAARESLEPRPAAESRTEEVARGERDAGDEPEEVHAGEETGFAFADTEAEALGGGTSGRSYPTPGAERTASGRPVPADGADYGAFAREGEDLEPPPLEAGDEAETAPVSAAPEPDWDSESAESGEPFYGEPGWGSPQSDPGIAADRSEQTEAAAPRFEGWTDAPGDLAIPAEGSAGRDADQELPMLPGAPPSEPVGVLSQESHDAAARKRRRRRGGRGRSRKERPAEPGAGAELSDRIGRSDLSARAAHDSHEIEATPSEHAEPAHATDGGMGTEGKRKRRKRGGRGRKKKVALEMPAGEGLGGHAASASPEHEGIAPGSASHRTEEAAGPGPGAGGVGKGRRRRHRRREGPHSAAVPAVAAPGPVAERSRSIGVGEAAHVFDRASAEHGRTETSDDEAPGGWWSRLIGSKKKPGREEE